MKTAIATFFALALTTSALADDSGAPTDAVERYKGIFNQLDVDASQSLSPEEAASSGLSGDSFNRLDSDGDGTLNLEEFLVLASETEATGSDTMQDSQTQPQSQ
ncbi:MAG: hypothetical protein VR73_15480 [Gammaproteobacteria bacterium BRH_c0]|nr:MAG: hypothetical protein VR73_15480 [Gammaproteobacteria bacterium BRH_c0]